MSFGQLGAVIAKELATVFERTAPEEVEAWAAIQAAKRIVLVGAGREGISTRAFTMRLMHLGLDAHWIVPGSPTSCCTYQRRSICAPPTSLPWSSR